MTSPPSLSRLVATALERAYARSRRPQAVPMRWGPPNEPERPRALTYQLLGQLVSICELQWDEEVGSAYIRRAGERFTIGVSPAFVWRHLADEQELLFVIAHELLHKLNADLWRTLPDRAPRTLVTEAVNIVADCRINAELLERTTLPGNRLLAQLYATAPWPGVLLRPPHGVPGFPPPTYPEAIATEARRLHADLWQRTHPFPELVDRLLALWQLVLPRMDAILLLGDHHTPDSASSEIPRIPGLDWRDLLAGDDGEACAGKGGDPEISWVEPETSGLDDPRVQRILQELTVALTAAPGGRGRPRPERRPGHTVVPLPGRRELLWLAASQTPVLYHPRRPRAAPRPERIHLYLDVSGSTRAAWRLLYGLAIHLGTIVGPTVYLFSTELHERPITDLRRGEVPTTGGTQVDDLLDFAIDHRHRRIVMVTDGYLAFSEASLRRLQRSELELYLLLTHAEVPENLKPLLPHVRHIWHLPEERFRPSLRRQRRRVVP